MSHNPYTESADIYSKNAKSAVVDPRSLEGQVLMRAAQKLELIKNRLLDGEKILLSDIDDAISYNRKLWTIFAADAANEEHPLPQEIKNNIASLAVFVFKHSMEIMAEPQPSKFDSLIEINKNIASGLLKSIKNEIEPDTNVKDTENKADLTTDMHT